MLRHEFSVESLGATICGIVTPGHLRILHHLSRVQALYEQETAFNVSEPSQALALCHTQGCTGDALHDRAP